MCLYPKLVKNKRYAITKKNNGIVPECTDERTRMIPVGCGKCIECKKKKKHEWQVRLNEEIKTNFGKFVTLTFSNESLIELQKVIGKEECNAVATIAVRRFLERWRKKYKKSVRHWLITELGHENTERIHLHGILFTEIEDQIIRELWKYGEIWVGDYCNEKTINYIIKYVTKNDERHKGYEPIILTSPGIGSGYVKTRAAKFNKFKDKETREYYVLPNGTKTNLPIYYRNKLYTEEERLKLWSNKLDEEVRYVLGKEISVKDSHQEYFKILKGATELNKRLGFGDDSKEWQKKEYNVTLNMLKKAKRIEEHKKDRNMFVTLWQQQQQKNRK